MIQENVHVNISLLKKNFDVESSDENDRSDDSSDSERSDSSSLSSSSLSVDDDFDNTSLIDPEILERNISPVIIPHPPPLSPVITIVNEKENNFIPPELPNFPSRSAIKPRSRLIMEI